MSILEPSITAGKEIASELTDTGKNILSLRTSFGDKFRKVFESGFNTVFSISKAGLKTIGKIMWGTTSGIAKLFAKTPIIPVK